MKHFLRPTLTAAALAVALGITAGAQAQTHSTPAATGTVDKAKASEILGYQLVNQIPGPMRGLVDPAEVGRATAAAMSGQKPKMVKTEEEAATVWKSFIAQAEAKGKQELAEASAKNKAAGEAFLAKNKKEPGVKTTAEGLQYKVISQGTGARPGPNDTVKVNYKGTYVDGSGTMIEFDNSEKHTPPGPAAIQLAGVIPGFRKGLQLMQVGGHYQLVIPPSQAYGAAPNPSFPPNATVIFDVTLVGTGPTPAGAQGGGGKGSGKGSGT